MQAVLIVERDEDLRQTLEMVVQDAGYPTLATGDLPLARAAITLAQHPLVVLVGHGGPASLARDLLDGVNTARPHAYIVISTSPAAAPHAWNARTARRVPVIGAPFDIDRLLAQIEAASAAIQRAAVMVRGLGISQTQGSLASQG